MKYHKIVTDAGVEFEVGKKLVAAIVHEQVRGKQSEIVRIYLSPKGKGNNGKGSVHAQVPYHKIDTIYFSSPEEVEKEAAEKEAKDKKDK